MARRIVSVTTQTPTATADTTNLVDATYPFILQGGSATQLNYIWEVSLGGQAASSSSPTFMLLALDTQVGSGSNTNGTGQTDSQINPATAALAAPAKTGNSNATNKPQRSATAHLLNLSVNTFGGNQFWRANRLEEAMVLIGNAAPATGLAGEASLSAFTGGTPGALGAHMIYESM
jgi:hypothetical protein